MRVTNKKIDIPIFNTSCNIIVCKKLKYANKKLKLKIKEDLSFYDGLFLRNSKGKNFIVLESTVNINQITHEVNHYINEVFQHINYRVNPENDEIQSYFLGWMCEEVQKVLIKHNKLN